MKDCTMKHSVLTFLLGTAALLCATATPAQTVYRIVGPDGKVTFSDKAPVSADQGKVASVGVGAAGAASNAALPFELRQVVTKYPVTLYTTVECSSCDQGRALLTSRGVPFSERTINTPEDAESFKRITGSAALPFLTIGSQRIKGMSEAEWAQYLDAAGYPKTSVLPNTFKNTPATPLVSVQKPTPAPKAEPKPAAQDTPRPTPAVNPANPAGIQF